MRRYVNGMLAGIFFLLACWCYLEAAHFAATLEQKKNAVTIQDEVLPLTRQQVRTMREIEEKQEKMFDFAAWTQQNGIWLETEFGSTKEVSAVFLCGQGEIVFPESAGLQEGDASGCLIDEKTARDLFGSTNVVGMPIFYDGTEKKIRGILRNVENTIVLQTVEEKITFPYVTVRCNPQQSRRQVENEFMTRHALNGKVIRMETVSGIANVLTVCFPAAVGIWVIRMAVRVLHKRAGAVQKNGADKKDGRFERMMALCVCAISAAACCWIFVTRLQIPTDMIPTKWSDFSFWSSWWEQERESLLILLLSEKQKPMQSWLEDFYVVLKYSLLSWISGWIFCRILGKYGWE